MNTATTFDRCRSRREEGLIPLQLRISDFGFRISDFATASHAWAVSLFPPFRFRIWFGFRISDFGFSFHASRFTLHALYSVSSVYSVVYYA